MNIRTIKYIGLSLLLALTIIVSQTGCKGKVPVSGNDFLLNTVCEITLYEGGDEKTIQETFRLCREYENRLSRTITTSEISRINESGDWVEVDPTTAEVVRKGILYGALSDGLFDITVGELSDLWNFSGEKPKVPEAAALAEAVTHVGYQKIEIEESGKEQKKETIRIRLGDGEAKLDLGGIAKGYIADAAATYLKEQGVTSALLNFGGNVVCLGEKPNGEPWKIGVEKPFSADKEGNRSILGLVSVKADQSVVTSGTYERQFTEDGKLYYHILDPKTGYPMKTDLDGVTIVGDASVDCDGLSTTCLMLGRERGTKLIDSLDGVEAVFVGKDGKVTKTKGIQWTEQKQK